MLAGADMDGRMTDHQRIRNAMFRAMLGPVQPRKLALWERAMVAMGLHRYLIYKGWMRPLQEHAGVPSFFGRHLEMPKDQPGATIKFRRPTLQQLDDVQPPRGTQRPPPAL